MSITAGSDILASDFVSTTAGAGDVGKVAKLDAQGTMSRVFLKASFGGNGADGALSITSGTTTIDLAGAAVFEKNYTSIGITGTGKLAFINPHANGSVVVLKSQGAVDITSSGSPCIDIRSLGGDGGSAGNGTGKGGRGAGALYIQCGGALNYTGTINGAGADAAPHTGGNSQGASAGGGGATVVILANTITANSGTTTVTVGANSSPQGGGTGTLVGGNGTDAYGIYGIFKGGAGGNNSNSQVSTLFGNVSLAAFACSFVPLMPGSGGGAGGYNGSNMAGSIGLGLGSQSSGAGIAVVGLNTNFV